MKEFLFLGKLSF